MIQKYKNQLFKGLLSFIKEKAILLLSLSFICSLSAQDLNIGNGGVFYLGETDFTTGGTVVTHHTNGKFIQKAGIGWSISNEYVDGYITIIGAGTTTVKVGDNAQSSINVTTASTDEILCDYTKSAATGTMSASLTSFGLSDEEFWTVTKTSGSSTDVLVSGLTNTATTYNGGESSISTPIVVRRDNSSSNWVKYDDNPGFGEFAFAAELSTLSIPTNELDSFSVYPNPINESTRSLQFRLPKNVEQLSVFMYDLLGKKVLNYINLPIKEGVNSINKPEVSKGIYIMQFSMNNNAYIITKKIILN